jgi:hypothetical protein
MISRLKKYKNHLLFFLLLIVVVLAGLNVWIDYDEYRWASRVYFINCSVFDSKMVPLINNFGNCVYLKNGNIVRYLGADSKIDDKKEVLSLLDKYNQEIWTIPFFMHHSMTVDHKEEVLYALSSEIRMYKKEKTKFDKIVMISLKDGTIIKSWSLFEILKTIEPVMNQRKLVSLKVGYKDNEIPINEASHFNSINIAPSKFWSEKYLIVNSGRGLVLFFDRNLNLMSTYWLDKKWLCNTHDAQLNQDGSLLIYRNFGDNGEAKSGASLLKIDMSNDNVLWSFNKDLQGKKFESKKFGSVQMFSDGSFLYSDMGHGGHFTTVSKEGEELNSFYYPDIDPRNGMPIEFHTVRRKEYSELSSDIQELMDVEINKIFLAPLFRLF